MEGSRVGDEGFREKGVSLFLSTGIMRRDVFI